MALSVLRITDGTTRVDLLAGNQGPSGFYLRRWARGRTRYKGGGTWQDSPLADGRQLVARQLDNVVETFEVGLRHSSQNQAARLLQTLDLLLEKAADYWASRWADEPVWLEVRGSRETNSQYALIYAGQGDGYGEPFGELFGERRNVVLDDLTYAVERGQWLDHAPGQSAQVAALDSSSQIIEHVTSNTGREVWIANKHTQSNLTNIYRYDDSAATYSSDLMGVASFPIFPDPPGVDDALYLVSRTTIGNGGPYSSIVFNVSKAQDDLTLVYEYWDGAAWSALAAEEDDLDDFNVLGKHGIYWEQPTDWATTTVNGITGYWVRVRVTAVGASPVVPQVGESPWAVVVPFLGIDGDAVGGTLPALARLDVLGRSSDIIGAGLDIALDRVVIGQRQLSRGENFTAYVNFSDTKRHPSISSVVKTHVDTEFTDDPSAPTSRRFQILNTFLNAGVFEDVLTVTFDPSYIQDFRGRYRVFLRAEISAPATSATPGVRIVFTAGGASGWSYTTPSVAIATASSSGTPEHIWDLGQVSIPPTDAVGAASIESLTIKAQVANNTSLHVDYRLILHGVVLIPIDEWSADFYNPNEDSTGSFDLGDELRIDGVGRPKEGLRSLIYNSAGAVTGQFQQQISGDLILQVGADQRFWFLCARHNNAGTGHWWWSFHEITLSAKLYAVQRYHGLRGDR